MTAIELVTADGEFRRVDHENEPDLFWALRGGGGNFGIVTALEVQLYVIPDIYAGVLFFPWERSSEVLHAWREWTETVPDEMTSVGRILQFPPMPELPEHLRGQKFVIVEGIYTGDEASGRDLMKPLRDLGPAMDTFAMVEPVGLSELHMDPPTPVPYTGAGHMLGKLDAAAIDRFVAAAGPGSGSGLVSSEIRHLGGELHRPKPGNGALATFDADFLTFGVGIVMDDASYQAHRAAIAAHAEAFAPVRERPPVPELHRGAHRPGAVLHPARLPEAPPGEAGVRPGQPDPGEPPDPRRRSRADAPTEGQAPPGACPCLRG